jgi:hypothetical protein
MQECVDDGGSGYSTNLSVPDLLIHERAMLERLPISRRYEA